jgi:hypothetical protein
MRSLKAMFKAEDKMHKNCLLSTESLAPDPFMRFFF